MKFFVCFVFRYKYIYIYVCVCIYWIKLDVLISQFLSNKRINIITYSKERTHGRICMIRTFPVKFPVEELPIKGKF